MLTIRPGPWVVAIEVGQGCDATIHDPLPASRAGGRLTCSRSAAREANRDGDLESGVSYTCIATRSDAVVVPPETCFLDPRGVAEGTVRNIYVQDFDRRAVVMHEDMPMDKRVHAIVRTILELVETIPR